MSKTANAETSAPVAKRSPGRPRKDGQPPISRKTAGSNVSDINSAKRKPGRPRKEPQAAAPEQSQEPKRARGRPADPNSLMGRARAVYEMIPAKKQKNRSFVVGKLKHLLQLQDNVAGVYYHKIIDDIAKKQRGEAEATVH